MDSLVKAKAQLIARQPFFATILLGQKMTLTEDVPTMATNGEEIFVNPKWIAPLSVSEIVFVL